MATSFKKPTDQSPDRSTDTEASEVAEKQLQADRLLARQVVAKLGVDITSRKQAATCRGVVELLWLEARIKQIETHGDALWCSGCAATGAMPPKLPDHFMVFECLEHAEEMLVRSAVSWRRSLFA